MEGLTARISRHGLPLAILVSLFLFGALQSLGLPGIYMDAANPDYLAAQLLHPDIQNPSNRLPDWGWPLLGGLYHGAQTTYLALLSFWLWGVSLESLRLGHLFIGLAVVVTFYAVSVRMTGSRAAAFTVGAALACEIALLSSLRTQFYIVLSGVPWLLMALYFIWPTQRRAWMAGVCLGLSIYAYFVFAFFLPVFVAALALTTSGRAVLLRFILGLSIGGGLYFLGYLALFSELGGWTEGVTYIKNAIGGLDPLASTLSVADRVANAWRNLSLALTGTGNELMIFHEPVASASPLWMGLKRFVFAGSVITTIWLARGATTSLANAARLLLALGLTYFMVSASLGNRLWIHHASVYLPLAYLLISLSLAWVLQWLNRVTSLESMFSPRFVALLLATVCVVGNTVQQRSFFEQLDRTGGLDRFSSAATRFALERLAHGPNQRVVFLDWGFLAGFVVNTQNRVPFSTELSLEQVQAALNSGHPVHIVAWKLETLSALQLVSKGTTIAYPSRNGATAFYVLSLFAPKTKAP